MKIKEQIKQEITRRSYADYVEYVHEGRWIPAKHLLFLCNKVQEFIERPTTAPYEILIVQMPPQHGKSQSITETLPSWFLGKNPYKRVIEVSYNSDFAQKFGRRNRDKIRQFGKTIFDIELSSIKDSNEEFELSNNVGGMISRGILSGVTGNPAELIIIDDPIKTREEADSETDRQKKWDEWESSIKTRCAAGCKVIVIMTRWHEDDLAGRLILYENNVEVINLPCEAEENDILGRKVGEALFPEIGKDTNWKDQFKQSYITQEGNRVWLALFQGRPTAEEGNMIKRGWFKYYNQLPQSLYKVISVDATFKDGDNNDYVSIQVWSKRDENYYLIDRIKARMDFPTTLQTLRNIIHKHNNYNAILIEDKANGSAIISMLQKEFSGVIPINPEGGKVARVNAISPLIESGNVYLPETDWINDFVEECVAFPNGKHDDDVDSMSQALNRLKTIYATMHKLTEQQLRSQYKYNQTVQAIAGSSYDELLKGDY